MLAVQFFEPGDIEALLLNEVPEPSPGPGEVVIELEASTINPADVKIRSGAIRPRAGTAPFTLGYDAVGVVVSRGPGADRFPVGQRVIGMSALAVTGRGTWSELVCLREDSIARAPQTVSPAVAAQLPLAGLTAYQALQELDPAAGDTVLVTGAAGAVGRLAVQLLRRRGVTVEALVRSSPTSAVLPPGSVDRMHLGSIGGVTVDGLLDTVGADFSSALRAGGRYVGVVPGCLPTTSGTHASSIVTRESGAMLDELARSVEREDLRLAEPAVFGLGEVRQAHHEFDTVSGRRVALVR